MDALFKALSNGGRRRAIRELRRRPDLKHGELLDFIGMPPTKRGQLTKHLDELEHAGLIERVNGVYRVVAADPMGRLLSTAAEVNVAAQRRLAERAEIRIKDAELEAQELQREATDSPDTQNQ